MLKAELFVSHLSFGQGSTLKVVWVLFFLIFFTPLVFTWSYIHCRWIEDSIKHGVVQFPFHSYGFFYIKCILL